jgi:thiol-disulfide isomerase/thioredoxin
MKRTSIHHILCGLMTLALLCTFAGADTRPAPQFIARTLDGETFTNSSLSGRVVLLQFWTTWCPVCRQDAAAVDNIESAFAGTGLVVLSIDVNEPEATVRAYLQANPRSCRVVVSDGHSLAAQFGVHSYPHYVVIDRDGNIAGSKAGGGGEQSLRYLLSRAGLSLKPTAGDSGNRVASASPRAGKPQWIEVPGAQSSATATPIPKTIFLLVNGERLEADHYTLRAGSLHVTVGGQLRNIPLNDVNIKQTIAANFARGIDLTIPTNGSQVFLGF